MFGAMAGDVIGSVFEWNKTKEVDFELFSKATNFTDDSVLTAATAFAITNEFDYGKTYKRFGQDYPDRGYGRRFKEWLKEDKNEPYDSWGNGSAMRVSPIGYAFNTEEEVLTQAKLSAECTHNHEEGVKGARATALAIFMARTGSSKEEIRTKISGMFNYDLDRTVDEIRPNYQFETSCQHTVPEAIIAFLDSTDFENAIRLAISFGGDADTLACITGGISEAFYRDLPKHIIEQVWDKLPTQFKAIIKRFYADYG